MTSVTLDDLEQDQQDIIEKTDVNTLAKYCRELQSYENEIEKLEESIKYKKEDYDGYYDHPGYGVFELFTKKDSLFAATPYITMWLDHYHYDT